MDPNKIGRFIYELRTEQSLSQYKLADMIPISRQAVSKWERGQTVPDSSTLIRLSEIFNVTINELLSGEYLTNDTIENLENTTLTILDEHNRRVREIKKLLFVFSSIITLLLLAFLTYYFVNSYKSIQVYKFSATSEKFDLYDGLFITTKQKSYFKFGELYPINKDINITNVEIFYYVDNKKILLFEDQSINKIGIEYYGYAEKTNNIPIDTLLKNSYIEITYNDNKKEIIKLNYKRDFINNNLFFLSSPKVYNNHEYNQTTKNILVITDQIINVLMENNNVVDGAYKLSMQVEEDTIEFTYFADARELSMKKNGDLIWYYFTENQLCTYAKKKAQNKECIRDMVDDIQEQLNAIGRT